MTITMDLGHRQRLMDRMSKRSTAELEGFFIALGLGQAFARPKEGWGRQKRINEALLEAERQGRLQDVLRAAAVQFEGATPTGDPPKSPVRIRLELQELHDEMSSWDTWVYADVAEGWQRSLNDLLGHLRVHIGADAPGDFQLVEREYSSTRKTVSDHAYKRLIRAVESALSVVPSASHSIEGSSEPIAHLHRDVLSVAQQLFLDGHYPSAIFEAFKAVNNRVKRTSGLERDGKTLMASAFSEERPLIRLNTGETLSERDEQEGFKFIFMGAMQGIRNPKAHEDHEPLDRVRAVEYLSLASLLMRRLDDADNLL